LSIAEVDLKAFGYNTAYFTDRGDTTTLTTKVLWAMLLGIIVGLVINMTGLNTEGSFTDEYVVGGLFYIVGKMFIAALKMLVVPLVFFHLFREYLA